MEVQGHLGERTWLHSFEYTLVLVNVAVPMIATPPPCKPKTEHVTCHSLGRWNVTHGFDSQESSPPATQNAHSIGQYSSGAMEEMRQKVQNASTHMLRCQNHDCACNRRSVQGAVQRGDGGSAVEGSKCQHSQTTMQKSRAHAQQLVSSWASSMGRWNVMHGFDSQESSRTATKRT